MSTDGSAPALNAATAHEAVRQEMHERVDLTLLAPPPASAAEWRERSIRLCYGMPGLRDELGNVPIGWFSLLEHAVLEIRRRLPLGHAFNTHQLKEKLGTLRWYGHVDDGSDEAIAGNGVAGVIDWAKDASASLCALFGTPDGHMDNTGGWLLTLSDRATAMRRERHEAGVRSNFSAMMYPRWDD